MASGDASTSSINAAALQLDLARRLKLPGTTTGAIVQRQQRRPSAESKHEPRATLVTQQSKAQSKEHVIIPDLECQSCGSMNRGPSGSICGTCGYYLSGVRQPALSLAQRRGLVQAPPKIETITAQAWAIIEARVDDRRDAFCPICMEAFKTGHEVLLSCSHMFHRQCLQAFEQFMGRDALSCPICRSTNYQKKITRKGSLAFETICAAKLQAMWRGFCARKTFHVNLRRLYGRGGSGPATGAGTGPTGARQRRRFYERELTLYADLMAKEVEERNSLLDREVNSFDRTLAESRQLDALFDSMLQQRVQLDVIGQQQQLLQHYHDQQGASSNARRLETKENGYLRVDDDENDAIDEYRLLRSPRGDSETEPSLWSTAGDDDVRSFDSGPAETANRGSGLESSGAPTTRAAGPLRRDKPTAPPTSEVQWQASVRQAQRRGHHECAVCMSTTRTSMRGILILSCSHVFHQQCIINFEKFFSGRRVCCICRQAYNSRPMTQDFDLL